jgi:hypothetical protein
MTKAKQTPTGNSKSKFQAQKSNSASRPSITRPAPGGPPPGAPARKRIPRPPELPHISSYAISLLNRKAEIANPNSPGDASGAGRQPSREWLTISETSRLSGYSTRHILNLCEQGFFLEGRDWKQRLPRPGVSRGGRVYIRYSALKKLDGSQE